MFFLYMGLSENSVPLNPMVLLIIIPFLNGYFIGGMPHFQTNPHCFMFAGFPGSQLRTCAPAGLGDLDAFSGHDQLCGTGGIGAPTESVESQWNLASKWGFHQQNMGDFPQET